MSNESELDTAEYWIRHLNLVPHPGDEEGSFAEAYRDSFIVKNKKQENRNVATNAYFVQNSSPPFTKNSFLFRCGATEMIYYHHGQPLTIKLFTQGVDEDPETIVVGKQVGQGMVPFFAVPKNTWFTRLVESEKPDSFCVYSCTLVPGFELADFEARRFGEIS